MQPRRRPVHRPWTKKNRIVLCLLKRSYERKYIAPIWSHIYRREITAEGFTNGIPPTTLDAQYQEMKGGGTGYEIYTHINNATQSLIEREYGAYLQKIRRAIQDLNLDVAFRTSKLGRPKKSQNPQQRPTKRRAVSIPVTVASEPVSAAGEFTNIRPELQGFIHHSSPYFADSRSTKDRLEERVKAPVPPILKISTDSYGNTTRIHPLLLFRATPTITSFCSRGYPNPATIIPSPPTFASPEFRQIVWPHLQRCRKYERSPFISLAQNPRNALRRVEIARSEESDKKMFLVIFAFNDVQADAEAQFGKDTGPYLVPSLFTATDVSDLPDGYTGVGEWLAYGRIGCEPIACLDSAQGIKLAKALLRFKAGDAAALLDVSECLRTIPTRWKQPIAYSFLSRYCGKARLPTVGSHPFTLLMQVIDDGETSSLARLVAYCERASTEEVERRWNVGHDGTSLEEDEEQHEEEEDEVESEVDHDGEKPRDIMQDTSRAVFRPVQVNVPHRSQLSSRSTVTRLNTLTTQRNNDVALRTQRAASTRMWSTDSESENNTQEPYNDVKAEYEPCREITKPSDEWDLIANDLETSFAEEFPSAARKLRLPHKRVPLSTLGITPSIEQHTPIDQFTAELLRSAYHVSPLLTPSRTSGQAARTTPDSATFGNINSSNSSFVDLDNHTISDYVVVTPQKLTTNTKKRPSLPPDTNNEEDVIVTGSGRRQRVRLTMRSLSVQDKEDDEFMPASEMF
ncbi:hypothetical protein LTR24_000528 [Lithohypha guttulata]|uniref:DUF7587 domain-containing protein n=1 Tax=Lithohypha guttulata TaxID=1690604 RepID=A0ABR0KQ67_9EURO|nr:hypothetical protein LTR24_000528 [Lithohypha guttulata]